jgi:hypothetical protein
MTETKRLNVADMDFDSIRDNLKEYLRSQDTLQDYDFEGSAITSIIDLLSYVTHFNAVNANVGLNETFLDSAQFRGSVVGHARMLGYTPRSASAPAANLDIVVTNANEGQLIQIPRGHRFKTKINNTSYTFVTTEDYISTDRTFSDVRIVQARFKTAEYIFDSRSSEKYLIPDQNVDTSTIRVEVLDSRNSSTSRIFQPVKTLTEIDSRSNAYFLAENPDGQYEISFGDGNVGVALEDGNIINIQYGVTERGAANGARVFTMVDPISGFSEAALTTQQVARGGSERESVESIRRNAPITFASQNRGVTPKDYEAIVRENFANVQSVKAWGGEDNDPPVYGKVFLSINPLETDILSETEKGQILNDILIPKSVSSVTPEILDPDFLYLNLDVEFKYDPSVTNLTRSQLETGVRNTINAYNDSELEKFGTVFRYSNFLYAIDESNGAILNSFSQIYLEKRFSPTPNVSRRYEIDFSTDLYALPETDRVIRSSSTFTIGNQDRCFLIDFYDKTRQKRMVSIVTGSAENRKTVVKNAGTIEGTKIILNNFAPSEFEGVSVRIEVYPNVYDIVATFNSILSINRINISGSIDSIVAGREFSGVGYDAPTRNP